METEETKTNHFDVLVLALFIIGHQIIGYGLGMITRTQIPHWYAELEKPGLTPPDWAFGVTWTILYLLISVSAWLLYRNRHKDGINAVTFLFILQLVLNWGWTFVFFVGHYLLPGALWIAALIIITGALMYKSFYISRAASLLLAPYFLWISFALYLNSMIWFLN